MESKQKKLKFGVALSGGGARGIAHIGVMKELQKAGIQIDLLAGTSMGGVIAASYAAGLTPSSMEEIATYIGKASNIARLMDLTLPRNGLLRGEKITAFFDEHLEQKTFADLDVPLTLTSVDLNSNREILLSQGSVAQAVRATVSIPGIFTPVEMDGMRLVDGGVLNNLPIDVVRNMGADVVLAVDVGWHGLGKNEFRSSNKKLIERAPLVDMAFVLYETIDLFLSRQVVDKIEIEQPEFLLHPEIPSKITSLTGYTKAEELIAIGEECARPYLPGIKQLLETRTPQVLHAGW